MPKRSSPEHRSLGTARAVLRVLTYIAEYPEGVGVEEVARYLGKSTYTAYYLLNSLCQEGYAEHLQNLHKYRLTPLGDRLFRKPPETDRVNQLLDELLEDLYQATDCRSYLWIYDGRDTVLKRIRGRQGQPRVRNIGYEMHCEVHATAIGKAVLAYTPTEVFENYVQSVGLVSFTANTITDPVRLHVELEQVRSEGLAFSRGEYFESVFGIAFALILCHEEPTVIATLGVAVPRRRFTEREDYLLKQVRGIAEYASHALCS